MASQILVIVSFLAISCSLAAAGIEPGPLQDFCVADPSSSGGGLIGLLKITLQLISFNHIQEINYASFYFKLFQSILYLSHAHIYWSKIHMGGVISDFENSI